MVLQRLASAVLASGVGVVRGRSDRGPHWANDAFLAMSGHDQASLAALDWTALAPEGVPPAADGDLATTIARDFRRRDGSEWPVLVTRGSDPVDPEQLILFVVDRPAAANQSYERFFTVANVAFWTSDAQGRVRLTSSTAAGRMQSDAAIDDIAAQAALIHPDDRAFAVATWRDALAAGTGYDIEVRARSGEGSSFRWTRLRAFPDVVNGEVTSWYGTSEDIDERRTVADALVESERRFEQLADDIPVMIWLTDAEGRATYLSKSWYDFTGQAEAEALGRGWMRRVAAPDRRRLLPIRAAMAERQSFDLDFRLRGRDGRMRWMLSSGRPRFDAAGLLLGYAGALTDIDAHKSAERELAEAQSRLSRALDGTGVGVWEWDAAADTVMIRGSALSTNGLGSPWDDYQEVDYRSAVHPDDRPRLLKQMADYINGDIAEFMCEIRVRQRGGGWIWVLDRGLASARDANGRATRMVGTLTNIDEGKKAAERLRWTVDHDALTGLASRTQFHRRLDAALAAAGPVALALLDIDDFKSVNDVLGHAAGDALLAVLAQRLRDFAYPHETVARLGGDEFTLIMPECGDARRACERLERLRTQLAAPFVHDGKTLTCRSSIGVAVSPDHGVDAETLLRSADIAMYSVKASGRGALALYEPAFGARVRSEAAALANVRAAVAEQRIVPLYEPIVRLTDGVVCGFEAHAGIAGEVDPFDIHDFDATFGDAELCATLGTCIVDRVIADYVEWRERGIAPSFVCVNVALAELRRPDYAARLLARLAVHDIPAHEFRIEIVETGLHGSRGGPATEETLAALSRGGLLAALDKFGVGAASLVNLSRLPLAAVKIDHQLVRGVASVTSDRTIIGAITALGESFGVRVAAVGVEDAAQAAALKELGCTYGQGSYFGLPQDSGWTTIRLKL